MPPKLHRYKLLLDENVETRKYFPILNNRHDLKHIAEDVKQTGIDDYAVYKVAQKQRRLIITYNEKDFFEFADKSKETGVIGISKNISPEQIDKKVNALLSKKTKGKLFGHFNRISGETTLTI